MGPKPKQSPPPTLARWLLPRIRHAFTSHDIEGLRDYRQRAPYAQRAHPTEEHFLPLLIALGARSGGEAAQVIDAGVTNGVLSMKSYAWGMTNNAACAATPVIGA